MSEQLTEVEIRMLSGEPFTFGHLCDAYPDGNHGRTIDGSIQKFRKKGFIAFVRQGRQVVWTATEAGKAAGQPVT